MIDVIENSVLTWSANSAFLPFCKSRKSCLIFAAAHRRHDADFAVATDAGLQSLIASHHLAVHKNVDVWPHLALLSQYAIAKSHMPAPKLIESFTDVCGLDFELDFGLSAGKFR